MKKYPAHLSASRFLRAHAPAPLPLQTQSTGAILEWRASQARVPSGAILAALCAEPSFSKLFSTRPKAAPTVH